MFYFVNAIFVNLSILKYRELFEQHYGREACYSVSFVDGAACASFGAAPYRTPIQSLLRRLLSFVRSEAQLAAELASQQAATQRAIAVAESEQGILSRTVRVCDCFFKGEKEAAGCKNVKHTHTPANEYA